MTNMKAVILGLFFLTIGAMLAIGKAHKHIESYIRMSEAEKANIKIGPLCRNVGTVIGLAGIGFLIAGLVPIFASEIFIWYMIAWFVVAGFDARFISKSGRYKK